MTTNTGKFVFTDEQEKKRREMEAAYRSLVLARDKFIASLKTDAHLPAWTSGAGETSNAAARAAAAAIYVDFVFPSPLDENGQTDSDQPDNQGKNTGKGIVSKDYGIVGASEETILLAKAYNTAKERFDDALKPLRQFVITYERGPGKSPGKIQMDRAVFRLNCLPNFSERQACRQVVVLDHRPERVLFSWRQFSSVIQVTVARLTAALTDMRSSPEVAKAIHVLHGLPVDEPIAVVRVLNRHMRVSIGSRVPSEKAREKARRNTVKAQAGRPLLDSVMRYSHRPTAMPILVPVAAGEELPHVTAPSPNSPEPSGKKRKLEDRPFLDLKSFSAYRYIEGDIREKIRHSAAWHKKLREQSTAPYEPVIGSRNRGLL